MIRLQKIILENVYSFEEKVEINFDNNLNFIIGTNNIGKTNIMRGIEFLLSFLQNGSNCKHDNIKFNSKKIY